MFDVIGKRRWFYLISLVITIPGLFFILLTPFTDAGLQFTIDYTGGTTLGDPVRRTPNVTPDQVEAVFKPAGPRGDRGHDRRRASSRSRPCRSPASPQAPPAPPVADAARRPPAARRAPARVAGAVGERRPPARPVPSPSPARRQPVAVAVRLGRPRPGSPGASPGASSSPAPPTGNTKLPTEGKLGEVAAALESELGPIAEQRSLTTIGAGRQLATSSARRCILILVGSIGILLWITYRFRDVKFGVTALVALLHDVIVVVGIFAILGTFFHVEIDALFVTAMLTVIGFSVHDTIVVFDRIRENKARHAGEPFADDRQPLDPADLRPVDHDQPDRRPDAARAAPVRRRGDPATSSWRC